MYTTSMGRQKRNLENTFFYTLSTTSCSSVIYYWISFWFATPKKKSLFLLLFEKTHFRCNFLHFRKGKNEDAWYDIITCHHQHYPYLKFGSELSLLFYLSQKKTFFFYQALVRRKGGSIVKQDCPPNLLHPNVGYATTTNEFQTY